MSEADRARRAELRRQTAVLRRTRLTAREEDLDPVDGSAALSLVTVLTRESWSATGEPLPQYAREEIPVRFVPRRAK